MNFTKLYYPTAESAYDDPDFVSRLLTDDSIHVKLTVEVANTATITIKVNNQILYSNQTNDKIQLDQIVNISDANQITLTIDLDSTNASISLTRCLIKNFDMLVYPLNENILVKNKNDQWINTHLDIQGQLSLTVTNPIQLWMIAQAPDLLDRTLSSTFNSSVTQLHNENIDSILKTML